MRVVWVLVSSADLRFAHSTTFAHWARVARGYGKRGWGELAVRGGVGARGMVRVY